MCSGGMCTWSRLLLPLRQLLSWLAESDSHLDMSAAVLEKALPALAVATSNNTRTPWTCPCLPPLLPGAGMQRRCIQLGALGSSLVMNGTASTLHSKQNLMRCDSRLAGAAAAGAHSYAPPPHASSRQQPPPVLAATHWVQGSKS